MADVAVMQPTPATKVAEMGPSASSEDEVEEGEIVETTPAESADADADAGADEKGADDTEAVTSSPSSDDTKDSSPDPPPKIYTVRIPRPDTSDLQSKISLLESRVAGVTERADVVRNIARVKIVAKQTAQSDVSVARDRLRETQAEVHAKLDVIKPLRAQLNAHRQQQRDVRDAGRELPCRTKEELDAKIASLEERIMHESLALSEEKEIIKAIRSLKTKYAALERHAESASAVVVATAGRGELEATIKALNAELDVLKLQEGAHRKMFEAQKEKLAEANAEVEESIADRNAVQKELNDAYAELKEAKGEKYKKDKVWYATRKQHDKLKRMLGRGDHEAVREAARAHNDEIHARMRDDAAYRAAYVENIKSRSVQWLASVLGPWGDDLLEEAAQVDGDAPAKAKKAAAAAVEAGAEEAKSKEAAKEAKKLAAAKRSEEAALARAAAKEKAAEERKRAQEEAEKEAAAKKAATAARKAADAESALFAARAAESAATAAAALKEASKHAAEILKMEKARFEASAAERRARMQARRAEQDAPAAAAGGLGGLSKRSKKKRKKKAAEAAATAAAAPAAEPAPAPAAEPAPQPEPAKPKQQPKKKAKKPKAQSQPPPKSISEKLASKSKAAASAGKERTLGMVFAGLALLVLFLLYVAFSG